MASVPILRPCGVPTIFGDLKERNIVFLLDTSGSMYAYLGIVKEHLTEVLLTRAFREKDTNFNMMEFSTEVTPWADKLVKCTPQTVTVAIDWITNLSSKTGSNMLDAFLAAFADQSCDSVYVVTDGLPDQRPSDILHQVALSSNGRQVHAIFMSGSEPDVASMEFLEALAIETAGTFHVISVSRKGLVEQIKPIVHADYTHTKLTMKSTCQPETIHSSILNSPIHKVHSYTQEEPIPYTSISTTLDNLPESMTTTYIGEQRGETSKYCSVSLALDNKPIKNEVVYISEPTNTVIRTRNRYIMPDVAWETYHPLPICHSLALDVDGCFSMTAGTLVTGLRVLARRDNDGYYYMGTVKQQVAVNKRFLIEFDQRPVGARSNHRLQETTIYDIIGHNDGLRHSIIPGDSVIAPFEKNGYRYSPGTVLEGAEGRSAGTAADMDQLIVCFFNGMTKTIPKQTAVWVHTAHYNHIKLEIQMPSSARQYLINDADVAYQAPLSYLVTQLPAGPPPCAVISGNPSTPLRFPVSRVGYYGNYHSNIRESAVKCEDVNKLIPGTTMTKDELNNKVMKQLMEHKMVLQDRVRLLNREEQVRKKNVSFGENSEIDSGVCSIQDYEDDREESDESEEEESAKIKNFEEVAVTNLTNSETQTAHLRDMAVGTDSSLLYHNKRRLTTSKQPKWRYWSRSLGSNELKFSSDYGPFQETAIEPPLEARPYEDPSFLGPVNRSAMFKSVDGSIKSDRAKMEWIMKQPHPPTSTGKSVPQQQFGTRLGSNDAAREAKENSFLEYRRKQIGNREENWKEKENQNVQMKAAAQERYRKYMADVIRRDVARQKDSEQRLTSIQDAKRSVSASINKHQKEHAERQVEKQLLRLESIRQHRHHREDIRVQRQNEIEDTIARRQDIKHQHQQQKWQEHSTELQEKRQQEAARDEQVRQKQILQRQRFQDIERVNQEKKDLRIAVREQKLQETRSQLLP